MDVLRIMAGLIEDPFLALVPAVLLLALFLVSRQRLIAIAAGLWLAYLPYEYGMKFRLLCSGECNIRVDLLVIYPALLLVSFAGLVAFAMGMRKAA